MTRGRGLAIVATVVSGILYALAFPPLRLRPVAWVALVPFLLVLRDAGWRRRLALGVLWTLVSGWSVGTWMPGAVASYFDQPLAIGVALFVIVTGFMAAPYYAAFAVAYGALARSGAPAQRGSAASPRGSAAVPRGSAAIPRGSAATPLLVGAAWAAVELARGRLLNGTLLYVGNSPWATLGYSQAGAPTVLQIASLTGVYGVSFLLAAVNAAVAEVVWACWHRRTGARATWSGAGLALGCAAAALAWGASVLRTAPPAGTAPVTVALVQGNVGAAVRWHAEGAARTLETYRRLTLDALGSARPRVVFWPEAALTSFIEQEDAHRHALAASLAGRDVELVFGAPRAGAAAGAPPYTNAVYLMTPDGALGARYDKQYLLPFMEYFPLRLDLARRQFGRVREFSPGAATPPLPTRAGAAGILVCNEAFLPHVAGARVAAGATYLVSPSNDSWVPDAGFAWQQFDIAAVRAVEQRRPLVRISDSGPSGVVDPWGRVVAHTEALTRDVLIAEVAATSERSLYGRYGDVFGVACAVIAATALVLSMRVRARD